MSFTYHPPGPVAAAFIADQAKLSVIQGPVGSGKSGAACIKIFRHAAEQKADPDGWRRTRWLVVRNSFQQLRDTTTRTWLDWFPAEQFGQFKETAPYRHLVRTGDVEMEVIFLALDKPEDEAKLRSLEVTGVWFNEARYIPRELVDAALGRVGRYPSMARGGPTWYGVMADTNPPPEDHWIAVMSGQRPIPWGVSEEEQQRLTRPSGWHFHIQPPALVRERDEDGNLIGWVHNPARENRANLPADYYENVAKGRSNDDIAAEAGNEPVPLRKGKPVFPEFREERHVAREALQPSEHAGLMIGVDFGLSPSAILLQEVMGRWRALSEVVAMQDMGAKQFGQWLKRELFQHYPGYSVMLAPDPAGDDRAQTDETTPIQIMRALGFKVVKPTTNDLALRLDAVREVLSRDVNGEPGLLVSPACPRLKAALAGGYHYRLVRGASGGSRYDEKPAKDEHSHPADALQYALLVGGEGRAQTVPGGGRRKAIHADRPPTGLDAFA